MGLFDLFLRNGARRTPGRTGGFPGSGTGEQAVLDQDRRALGPLGAAFCLLLVLAAVGILDFDVLPPQLKVGQIANRDIEARVNFFFDDPQAIVDEREARKRATPPAFRSAPQWREDVLRDLRTIVGNVQAAGSADEAVALSEAPFIDRELVRLLYRYDAARHDAAPILLRRLDLILKGLEHVGVLSDDEYREVVRDRNYQEIVRHTPNEPPERKPVDRLISINKAKTSLDLNLQALDLAIDDQGRRSDALFQALKEHLFERLKPSLVHDPEATRRAQQAEMDKVINAPRLVRAGTLIVRRNDVIRAETLDKLRAEARAFKGSLPLTEHLLRWSGLALMTASLLFFFILTLQRLRVNLNRRRALAVLGLVVLAVLAIAKALMISGRPAHLAPVAFAAICASLAFNQGVAVALSVTLSILVGFAAGLNLPVTMALMIGASVSALPGERLQNRWDLLRFGLTGGVAAALTLGAFALLAKSELDLSPALGAGAALPSIWDMQWGAVNCVVCGMVMLGALPIVEWAFGIITNIRLFELCDQNQPALRKIQLEAPGTWAHTLQVAFLSEPASEAVGANARLVRAGVYYHDLGKTLKPEYFVENQMDAEARHRRLAPSVSALIITSHVKDGVELAREFGLPKQIVDFIPEHHGTTLVSYFFHSAKKKAEADEGEGSGEKVQEAFFRYPGPKPQSRETAIVMLADTVEAATRTLENPSAKRLRGFIHELIMAKLLDRQLDECGLSFRDLAIIENVFTRVLATRFHSRIKYPGQEGARPEEGKDEERDQGKAESDEEPPAGGSVSPNAPTQPMRVPSESKDFERRQAR